jgi:RND superfamily putative drug exporter
MISAMKEALFSLPAGRGRKWLVLALWAGLLAAGAPLAARFERSQVNDPATFLPGGSESLQALELARRFESGQRAPAVVVFRRDTGLTPADRRAIAAKLAALGREVKALLAPPPPPRYARDGKAALVALPLSGADAAAAKEAVEEIRAALSSVPPGLVAKVGGPAGLSADLLGVFEGVNTRLLLAAALLVLVLLVLIYRSPVFWLVPLLAIFAAEGAVRALGSLAIEAGVRINGQTAGILLVLVFGAGTDYALLLVARYREELRRNEDRHAAMVLSLARAGPAIVASAGTVVAGLACLGLAEVNATAGIGTIGAIGVAVAALSTLTLLPALLLALGRWVFWPFVPRVSPGSFDAEDRRIYRLIGNLVARAPRRAWLAATAALLLACVGLLRLDFGLTPLDAFRGETEAVEAQRLIARSFPAGESAPAVVVVRRRALVGEARRALARAPGVAALGPTELGPPGARFDLVLESGPYSREAQRLIPALRERLARAVGEGTALIGGPSAEERDTRVAASRDTRRLPPLVLAVVLAILALLLRALVAPLVLVATVVLSFAAALGASAVVFDEVFGLSGVDPSFPLIAFIFLVALGVDYNIFLMARVREEAQAVGTREGLLRGLAATGAVITSAGVVLAGTFAVLGVLPFVPLIQIGFTVAFGVLLDTLLVRTLLVPALVLDLDRATWWPSRLARAAGARIAQYAASRHE